MVLPPAPHRVLAQSGQVLDVSPGSGSPELGQGMAVSLLQLLSGALHLLPATGDHWHCSTSTHTPPSPKGAKLDFKARPLFGWGQPLRLQADVFPHALSYISQEIPRKTTLGGQRSCFLTHALHDLSPERLGGQIATPKRVRQQHPNPHQRAPALTCFCSVPPVPGHLQVPDLSQSLQNHRGAGEAGKR